MQDSEKETRFWGRGLGRLHISLPHLYFLKLVLKATTAHTIVAANAASLISLHPREVLESPEDLERTPPPSWVAVGLSQARWLRKQQEDGNRE